MALALLAHGILIGLGASPAFAQTLLDRVMVRVDGYAITLTDVRAAIGLGLVETPANADEAAVLESAVQQMADRQLLLNELVRFPPPEPAAAAVDSEVAALKARVGNRLPALIQATGLDDARIRDLARDTVRLQAYMNQRFGVIPQVTDDDAARYYRAHPEEFSREGVAIPFQDAQAAARERAGAERRRATVAQLVRDLRSRAEVVEPTH